MKKTSNVRFASDEKVLLEFRSIYVLQREVVVTESHFHSYFSANTATDRNKRAQNICHPILSEHLLKRVEMAHGILLAYRTYLRVFDSETVLYCEVSEATSIL